MTRLRLDHIAIGASSLDEGRRWLESKLGVPALSGGKHALMGTHNALWQLDCCYLEVIAVDPDAGAPNRPRWFGLDNPLTIAQLRTRPRLLTWITATNAIALDIQSAPVSLGQTFEVKRDNLSWKISVSNDGSMPVSGAFPTLIEWRRNVDSPAETLPDQGLKLEVLDVGLTGDRARWLTERGIGSPVVFGNTTRLSATIRNPARGVSLLLD